MEIVKRTVLGSLLVLCLYEIDVSCGGEGLRIGPLFLTCKIFGIK